MDMTEQYYTSDNYSDDGEQYADPEDCTTSISEETSPTSKTVFLPTESWD